MACLSPSCAPPGRLDLSATPCDHEDDNSGGVITLVCCGCHSSTTVCRTHYALIVASFIRNLPSLLVRRKCDSEVYNNIFLSPKGEALQLAKVGLACRQPNCSGFMKPVDAPTWIDVIGSGSAMPKGLAYPLSFDVGNNGVKKGLQKNTKVQRRGGLPPQDGGAPQPAAVEQEISPQAASRLKRETEEKEAEERHIAQELEESRLRREAARKDEAERFNDEQKELEKQRRRERAQNKKQRKQLQRQLQQQQEQQERKEREQHSEDGGDENRKVPGQGNARQTLQAKGGEASSPAAQLQILPQPIPNVWATVKAPSLPGLQQVQPTPPTSFAAKVAPLKTPTWHLALKARPSQRPSPPTTIAPQSASPTKSWSKVAALMAATARPVTRLQPRPESSALTASSSAPPAPMAATARPVARLLPASTEAPRSGASAVPLAIPNNPRRPRANAPSAGQQTQLRTTTPSQLATSSPGSSAAAHVTGLSLRAADGYHDDDSSSAAASIWASSPGDLGGLEPLPTLDFYSDNDASGYTLALGMDVLESYNCESQSSAFTSWSDDNSLPASGDWFLGKTEWHISPGSGTVPTESEEVAANEQPCRAYTPPHDSESGGEYQSAWGPIMSEQTEENQTPTVDCSGYGSIFSTTQPAQTDDELCTAAVSYLQRGLMMLQQLQEEPSALKGRCQDLQHVNLDAITLRGLIGLLSK
jgi:hypothetical protein